MGRTQRIIELMGTLAPVEGYNLTRWMMCAFYVPTGLCIGCQCSTIPAL